MAPARPFTLPPGCAEDSIILSFPVPPEYAGMRLDLFIQTRIPRLSRTKAAKIVKACGYREDGAKSRASDLVRTGETQYLVRPPFEEPSAPRELPIVYEDETMMALNKPPGLPVHPSASYHRNTVSFILQEKYGYAEAPRIAHRLDRETSGLLLCSRSPEHERALKWAFEDRKMKKTYLAIVRGQMRDDTGTIDMPMARPDTGHHVLMAVRPDGLQAVTDYRVRARGPAHSLVELFPRTGRQHQLRVHLSAIGHSIVGDKLYGPEREAPFLESIQTGVTPALIARLGHDRHALHAHSLTFAHPSTGQPLTLEAPLSPDLVALWEQLGAPASLRSVAAVDPAWAAT
ncbi:MAG TPA: RluA family pseudouridine synthase [Polyangiales bacterium]|nr:RluA family pseudouridine synthase [Polyangiales bacterium]